MPILSRLRREPPALILFLILALAWLIATPAHADTRVRVEWLKGPTNVIAVETLTSSGSSVASAAAPSFGGVAGSARITVVSGAAVISCCGSAPVATQTNGFRMQVADPAFTIPGLAQGTKLAIIEATDPAAGVGGGGGGGGSGDASASNQLAELARLGEVQTTPTLYTVLGRLKSVETKLDGLDTRLASIDTKAGDTSPVATKIDQTTPGSTDSVTVKNMGAAGTGITAPTGGSGLLGFLSGVFDRLGSVLQVGGDLGHGATETGKPVGVGCWYPATPPGVSPGQRVRIRCGPDGSVAGFITSPSNPYAFAQVQPPSTGASAGNHALAVTDGILNNKAGGSTALDPKCGIGAQAANRSGACIQGVAQAATNDAGQAIPRTVSGTSAAAGMQLCSAACNWFGGSVTAAAAGYYIIYDQASSSAPADGTQTWAICRAIGVGTTVFGEFRSAPARFNNGAYAVKSSTGCGTKTAVTDAFFESYAVQ